MACPTCGHTMQNLGVDSGPGPTRRVFWCPRCGTLREELSDGTGAQTSDEAPKLVGRCREFGETLGPAWFGLWRRLGILEAIHTPGDRPEAT